MNERLLYHRVIVSGVLRDAQTSVSRSHKSVQTFGCVLGSDRTSQRIGELEGNGY